ncbi:MAG: hypothetical protein RIG82_00735 [Phycisphaeraceae bacterium]
MTTAAQADPVNNFRSWLGVNGFSTNATTNLWYGTTGVNGPLMGVSGTAWVTPTDSINTPLFSGLLEIGDNNGAAGPATFPGTFVHPGPSQPAVLVYAPQTSTPVSIVELHAELVTNGLTGNGLTIDVYSTINSLTSHHGGIVVAGNANAFHTPIPVGSLILNPGDTLKVVIGNNGSYLFDHLNLDVTLTLPEPASAVLLMLPLGLSVMRRR